MTVQSRSREALDQVVLHLRAALYDGISWSPAVACERTILLAAMGELMPEAKARLRSLGVDERAIEESLAEIERKQRDYGDLVSDDWLVGVFVGDVLCFGRLQYARIPDAEGRDIHVPENGPLTPESVDDSLTQAATYFGPSTYICTSWLFDPHLAQLPDDSNIRAFASRFTIEPALPTTEGAHDAAKFAFHALLADIDSGYAASDTALQRIVRRVLTTEGTWAVPTGLLSATPTTGEPDRVTLPEMA